MVNLSYKNFGLVIFMYEWSSSITITMLINPVLLSHVMMLFMQLELPGDERNGFHDDKNCYEFSMM